MKTYTNSFHSGHLYLKIDEAEADTILPSRFDELIETNRKPLQVIVSSTDSRIVDLLRRSGFLLKRKCFETEACTADLLLPLSGDCAPLLTAEKGTPAFSECAKLMYRYYAETHRPVNPLTATESEFFAVLPNLAFYDTADGRISSAAFVEDDEIAYVCTEDGEPFTAFAQSLVSSLLKQYGAVCFEADDTDRAAMQLRGLFAVHNNESFDTYVKPAMPDPGRLDERAYLADPCGASSLPFWKTDRFTVPDNVTVYRDDEFRAEEIDGTDEPYFKVLHDLTKLDRQTLPPGYETVRCGFEEYASHINACYTQEGVTGKELETYAQRPTYDPSLWLAIRDAANGRIVATGIAELDARIGEGILEWIQVSPDYRRKGLGRFVVRELLYRLKGKADFVTVSGKRNDPCDPLALYRSCGFRDLTVWHVVRKGGPA